MYGLIRLGSILVRQFCLPNPFLNYIYDQGQAELFNLVFGGVILQYLAYWTTGIYYEKNSCPALGSLSYLLWYAAYTFYFIFIGNHINNLKMAITILGISIVLVFIVIYLITNKIRDKSYF
ncbi:MAG: hypothetical protein GX265_06020 [Mollicutes bacterium]|nr:hypothetical protein [Mollicutes bacterium]